MIAAVILAAGASTRFGSPKQRVLLPRVVERARASSVDDVIVVLGAHDVETDARVVRCPEWEQGPGASLRCGLDVLDDDVEAAVVVLGDGPNLDPRAIDRVISVWRRTHSDRVAAASGSIRFSCPDRSGLRLRTWGLGSCLPSSWPATTSPLQATSILPIN